MIARLLLIPSAWFGTLIPTANPPAHYTDLTWTAAPGTPPEATYAIYKAPGKCADAVQFTKIASGISSGPAGLSYRDYAVQAGQAVCYYVTAGNGTQESGPSPKADAVTPMERQAQ